MLVFLTISGTKNEGRKMVRARACIRCREYIIIRENDSSYQELERIFEGNHRGHNLVTLDLDEIRDSYSNVGNIKE